MKDKNPINCRLNAMLISKFISDTGTWVSVVLLLLYTNEVSISKAQGISLVFALRILMPLLATPLIARFVDQNPSGKWLCCCDLAAGLITFTIPYFNSIGVTAIIAGTLSTVTAIHFSAFNRLMVGYTSKGQIKSSILKQSLLEGFSLLIGTSLAAIVGSLYSFKVGFAIDSLTFLVSAMIVSVVFSIFRVTNNESKPLSVLEEHNRRFLSIRTMPWLLMISTFAAICLGLRDVTLIQLMVNELGLQKSTYALAVTTSGIGGILGNLLAHRISITKAYFGLALVFVAIAAIYLGVALSSSLWFLFCLIFMLGLIEACYYYFRSHIFFTITPEDYLARGSGVFKIFNATARSGGVIVIGLVFSFLHPSKQFLFFSILAFVAASLAFLFKPLDVEKG